MLNKVNVQTKEQKFCVILRWIEKNKNILFDQHSTYHFNLWATKWQEIYKEAVKLDIAPAQKGWKYLKDDLWQKWKAQTMEKVSDPDPEACKVRTLTSLNESDKIICNILGLKVEPVEILAIKDEIDKESGDEDIEISSDDDDVILQSASSSTSSLKPCNITFIPVQKTKDINSKSLLPLSRNSKIKFIGTTPSTSNERVTYNLNSNEDISTKHTENNFDKLDTTADTTLQFLSETKNTHKMILENVRDIKMKLLMQKKSTHCETCNNTNKEMLSVQNQILEVQQQNLQIQMQIIQEIKNVSEHLLNKIQKNNTPEGSEKDEKEKYGNLLNSESNGESSNEEDPLTNMQTRKRFKK